MGVTVKSNVESDFAKYVARIEKNLYAALAEAMIVIMHDAELDMKYYTARRGRPNSSGSGRIDSGDMFDALSSRVEFAAKKVTGEAGFVGGAQDYFIYQTVTGFQHWLSDEFIPPTQAIEDAEERALKHVQAEIEQAIRSVR